MRGTILALAVVACAASTAPAMAQLFDNGAGPCTGLCRFFSGGPADDGAVPVREPRIGHRLRRHVPRAAFWRRDRDMPERERAVSVEPRRHRRPSEARHPAVPVVAISRAVGGALPKPVSAPVSPARIEPAALATPSERPAASPDSITAAPLE